MASAEVNVQSGLGTSANNQCGLLPSIAVKLVAFVHRLEEIFALADRVTVLRDGESVGTNPVDGLSESQMIELMVGREVEMIYPPATENICETVISLQGLSCATSGVRDVDLDVAKGEILGLAGLVGAGRTELARILFGVTPADSGKIFIDGTEVKIGSPGEAIRLGIGYVPEDRRKHGLVLEMKISENITMAAGRKFFPGGLLNFKAESKAASHFIESLGIKASGADALGGSLSGGNQQKVSVARWLATEPKLLILDEPTQGVDVGAKAEIHGIIRELVKDGMAVVMISSDLPEVLGMSDRVAVMREGRIEKVFASGEADAHSVMMVALGSEEVSQ